MHQIQYGNSTIDFSLQYSQRKTLGISVFPNKSVRVTAPANSSLLKVIKKVKTKAKWIQRQQRKFAALERPVRIPDYVSGETWSYMGRKYRLRITKGIPQIKKSGKFFQITVAEKNSKSKVKSLINGWYKDAASKKLRERFEKFNPIIEREKIKVNSIIIRHMEKRWGSCTEKGNIILNPELIKVPVDCIDYVIIHEICHLKYLHHNKKFYQLLTKYLPDWEKKKKKLELY